MMTKTCVSALLGFTGSLLISAASAADFQLSSPTLKPDATLPIEQVFNGFGCSGKNISPALSWTNPPAGTQSYALTVYDPDAPTGSGWWHWVVYNIPADTHALAEGAGTPEGKKLPAGTAQGRTDFGTTGFGGACPPEGDKPHRYIFTLHALNTPHLDIPEGATAALIGFMINAHRIEQTQFTAYYGR